MGYAALALGIASIIDWIWSVYSTQQSTAASDRALEYTKNYVSGAYRENTRYWDDYVKRHHLEKREIMYPYRTGFNYDLSKVYTSDARLVSNDMARTGTYVYGATSTARTLIPKRKTTINYNS